MCLHSDGRLSLLLLFSFIIWDDMIKSIFSDSNSSLTSSRAISSTSIHELDASISPSSDSSWLWKTLTRARLWHNIAIVNCISVNFDRIIQHMKGIHAHPYPAAIISLTILHHPSVKRVNNNEIMRLSLGNTKFYRSNRT